MIPLEPTAATLRYLSCQTRLDFAEPADAPRFLSAKGARVGTTALYRTESVVVVYSWLEGRPDRWESRGTMLARRILKDGTDAMTATSFDWYSGQGRWSDTEDEAVAIMSALSSRYLPRFTPAQVAEDVVP